MNNKDYSRKEFINKCLSIGGLLFSGALFLNSCNTNNPSEGESGNKKQDTPEDCNDMSGVSEEELKKRQSLGYVTKSSVPDNYCGNCGLYTASGNEMGCGGCLLFKGPVFAEGHCVQWAPKAS